jgi:hypothetical protein
VLFFNILSCNEYRAPKIIPLLFNCLSHSLFVLPTLISVILNVFGITSNEICIFQ